MKTETTIIYDNSGRIHTTLYGTGEVAVMTTNESGPLECVDVSDPENPRVVIAEVPETAEERINRQLSRFAELALPVVNLTDEQALEVPEIYPEWEAGVAYKAKKIVRHGVGPDGVPRLYRIVKAHTSQTDWVPDTVDSLYAPIGFTAGGVEMWKQPAGAHDAYAVGDQVEYDGKIYVSTIDGNVWEPGVAGWELAE